MSNKISVIVPVYDVEPYLERCLDSIINNTYQNLEIICVNDGCTDGCGAILDRYAQKDFRIQVITQDNGGLSAARNSGMDAATGDFIAFIDSDDWIHPQYFEILMYMQEQNDYDLVICGFSRPTVQERYLEYSLSEVTGKGLNLEDIFRIREAKTYAWGKLYRSKLVAGKRFVEGVRIAEDAAFNALVLGAYERVRACYLPIPLYYYFDRPGSLAYMLKGKETLALGEILDQYAKKTSSFRAKRIYFQETLKRGLSARYSFSLQREEKEYGKRSNVLIHDAMREMYRLPNVPLKEKIQYGVFGYVPITYRLFRIINDPTLIQMEKDLKKKK